MRRNLAGHYDEVRTDGPDDQTPMPLDEIQSVALHEIGHSLGLKHSKNATDIMYYISAKGHSLTTNDLSALTHHYEDELKLHQDKVRLYNRAVDQFNSGKFEASWDTCVQILRSTRRFNAKAWHIIHLIEGYAKTGLPEVRPLLAHSTEPGNK